MNNPEKYMKIAYKLAEKAAQQDEVPVGCVIVYQDKVIARGYNTRKNRESTIDHAEIVAIRKANIVPSLLRWNPAPCVLEPYNRLESRKFTMAQLTKKPVPWADYITCMTSKGSIIIRKYMVE